VVYTTNPPVLASPPPPIPQSVKPEYLSYQCWDTVQALCSYLRGILTTKAILEGSGVGSGSSPQLLKIRVQKLKSFAW
jgi:hypothetical protein